MKIALDYDKTFSLDPAMWRVLMLIMRRSGHDVRIITIRDDRFDRTQPLCDLEEYATVIYTRGVSKQFHLTHIYEGDFQPDVWIDDNPRSIFENSSYTPEGLCEWRGSRGEGPTIPISA